MSEMKIIFYYDYDYSCCPLIDWLDKADKKVIFKCLASIELLKEKGNSLRRPHADYLRDEIYELRIKVNRIHYRILYFFNGKDIIVLSHGITKKSDIVPSKEIDLAINRKNLFKKDPVKHTYKE